MKLQEQIINVLFFFIGISSMNAANNTPIDDNRQPVTQQRYLSGTGCDDAVKWDFYCTGGRASGKWSTIDVPSCWECQGFGEYQYGIKFYGKENPEGIMKEQGLYKHRFTVPDSWKGQQVELVFEGVMTDAKVIINGKQAGAVHHGAFYRFAYDITDKIVYEFPETGIAVMTVVPGVRNKVNATDLNGPSAQPVWVEQGLRHVRFNLTFK